MITTDQAKTIRAIIKRFNDSEVDKWTDFDDQMVYLDYLDDRQLVTEAIVRVESQLPNNPRCSKNHPIDQCIVPHILRAVAYVVDDYEETGTLVKSTRYMLQYYLAASATGIIITD